MNKKLTCAPFTEAEPQEHDRNGLQYNYLYFFIYKKDIIAPQAQICARFELTSNSNTFNLQMYLSTLGYRRNANI